MRLAFLAAKLFFVLKDIRVCFLEQSDYVSFASAHNILEVNCLRLKYILLSHLGHHFIKRIFSYALPYFKVYFTEKGVRETLRPQGVQRKSSNNEFLTSTIWGKIEIWQNGVYEKQSRRLSKIK